MLENSRSKESRSWAMALLLAIGWNLLWSCGGGGSSSYSSPTAPFAPPSTTNWNLSVTLSVRNTNTDQATLLEASVWLDGVEIGRTDCSGLEPCNAIGVHGSAIALSGSHELELRVDQQVNPPNDYGAGGGANIWVASDIDGSRGIRRGIFSLKRDFRLDTGEGFTWLISFA